MPHWNRVHPTVDLGGILLECWCWKCQGMEFFKKENKQIQKILVKSNCRYCFPLFRRAHHSLLVKLNWSSIICSSQNYVDYYAEPCTLLDVCKLIVWWFAPVSSQVSKINWIVYNYYSCAFLCFKKKKKPTLTIVLQIFRGSKRFFKNEKIGMRKKIIKK